MRQGEYPGSDLVVEEVLEAGSNYQRSIVSYLSEGLKIYALLTVPNGPPPATGWPVIVFNHGYIPPAQYRTTERYVAYVDGFARNGYIVLRPDYRGHGFSEGEARGAYTTPDYVVDVLNAVATIKRYPTADPERLGMWGHSMGGYITLRAMVIAPDIKVGVIWAGVVGSYADLLTHWRRSPTSSAPTSTPRPGSWRNWAEVYGSPAENPAFWDSISANAYLEDLSGPVQIHHGTADADVPIILSEILATQIAPTGQTAEYYVYPDTDHNLRQYFSTAMQRSVAFFDAYLKNK